MNTENESLKRPDKKQIAEWKKEHGELFQIDIEGGHVAILRKPRLKDLEAAQASTRGGSKPFMFNRSIYSNCKLYEDPAFNKQGGDSLLAAVYAQLDEIIEIKEAEVKKL